MKRFEAQKAYLVFMLILSVFIILPGYAEATWDKSDNTTVTSTVPANAATGVPIGSKLTATFSEAMAPATITRTTFTLKRGTKAVSGTVTYSGVTAVFIPASNLLPGTVYTATITTGAKDLTGNALARNHVWKFTTGAAADATKPTVTATVPVNAATGVPIGNKLTATFSEAMNPLTISATTFTLKQGATAVPGSVTYSGVTAVFTPASYLNPGTVHTATITTLAKDLAGNALARNHVWSFTTGTSQNTSAPSVSSTIPVNGATGVPIGNKLTAIFSESMDPLTVTTSTFTLKQGATLVPGTVTYSGVTTVFTPANDLAANTSYTALITTGARDLAGNALASGLVSNPWSFTTAAAPIVPPLPPVVNLLSVAPFGAAGGAGVTSCGNTLINGNISTTSASTLITGLTDGNGLGNAYSIAGCPGIVNGTIYTAPPAPGNAASMVIATQAQADAQIAFDATSPASMPGGILQTAELGGLTLAPGVYTSGTSFGITTVDLTLDAQGNPNAFWVFQSPSTVTVGTNVNVILANGALAKNVFWHVSSAATINAGAQMKGTILAFSGVSMGTGARLDGRAISLVGGPVTLLNNIINVPAP